MGLFDVDYDFLNWTYLPVRRRVADTVAWLRALTSPVRRLNTRFRALRVETLYFLAHNGQVCYLEAALNDVFDAEERRIFISDPEYRDPVYLFRTNEERPVYLSLSSELPVVGYDAPRYLYLNSELYNGSGVQFIVNVPAAVTYNEARLRALVNKYRLASKSNFEIVVF